MKKFIITSTAVMALAVGSAHAGFYITPQVSYSMTSINENRTETKVINTAWAPFAGNKIETWDNMGHKITPKIAVGFDYETRRWGTFGLASQYGAIKNSFNCFTPDHDFKDRHPNDTDTRDFSYDEKTLSLNATYGYRIKYIIPFVTAGIGYTTINSESNFRSGRYFWSTRDQENTTSWNIGAGLEIPVTKYISATLMYMYTDLGHVKYNNPMYFDNNAGATEHIDRVFKSDTELTKQEIVAGIKISF